jgi:uncharacterized membrane protein
VVMAIDHVRDYFNFGGEADPMANPGIGAALFFTRWITHFCAPTFVFLSGVSIYLQKLNGKSNAELSRFLWTRGLWLIILEFTIVRFGIVFNLDYSFFGMAQVIWVIGVSMIVMAALIHLPLRAIGTLGLSMILLHDLLDFVRVPPQIAFAGTPPPDVWQSLWIILHQPGVVPLFGNSIIFFAYPLIPWMGVMAAGYAVGTVYSWETARRRRMLLKIGIAATILFAAIRLINVYGDPVPWSIQATPIATFLSFLNTTKYPPSLLFLLMTLGPALIVLALTDRVDGKVIWQRICAVYGRVPMFYYILQWFVAHGLGILLSYFAGKDFGYLFLSVLQMGQAAPPGHGFPLWVVYAVWISGLVILYPLCASYGKIKRNSRHWAFSYL